MFMPTDPGTYRIVEACITQGISCAWSVFFKKGGFSVIFSPTHDPSKYTISIFTLDLRDYFRHELLQIEGMSWNSSGAFTGDFPLNFDDFSSLDSPFAQSHRLLVKIPKRLKKFVTGSTSLGWEINGTIFSLDRPESEILEFIQKEALRGPEVPEVSGLEVVSIGGAGYGLPGEIHLKLSISDLGFVIGDPVTRLTTVIPYSDVLNIEMQGGMYQKGGGFIGGGFGLAGFAIGAATSMALNKISSRTKIETVIRISTSQGEVNLFTDQATPEQLDLEFAEPRRRIKLVQFTGVRPEIEPKHAINIADELAKLADLRDKGVLTEPEFDQQKKKLLGL